MKTINFFTSLFGIWVGITLAHAQKVYTPEEVSAFKSTTADWIRNNERLSQVMVDKVFSFAELGFQEQASSEYLTSLLEKNGFDIQWGLSGIPTAWVATWSHGSGPVIALGSDVDCIPKASQYPGVAYHKPMVEGAPGHGEGHNAGIPLNITAALAVQQVMKANKIGGTLMLWPGIAEELVAAKAWFVRDGVLKGWTRVFLPMSAVIWKFLGDQLLALG